MKIAIISRLIRPVHCGIGDHTFRLKVSLNNSGHKVIIIAGKGGPCKDIFIIKDDWSYNTLSNLIIDLDKMKIDQLVLQYTPLSYYTKNILSLFNLNKFWRECGARWNTCLILHETYFKTWRHPTSIIRGTVQKYLMKDLVRSSQKIFTASQPLAKEVKAWSNSYHIKILPIGSNIDVCPVNRDEVRIGLNIKPKDIVITLYGGGNSLKWLSHYVNYVDKYLTNNGIEFQWLFLGGVPTNWFTIKTPVLNPGWLSPEELSRYLQVTDIFLVPHFSGASAKRGTIITAMQHGLPVVGTKGQMTDDFWSEVLGVKMVPLGSPALYANTVLELALNPGLREEHSRLNKEYFNKNFTWEKISKKFLQ